MYQRTKISAAALIVLGGMSAVAHAQSDQQPQQLERVEVTGSSIKRIAGETALPVTTLTAADIKKTGATSVTDLIQMLPQMQGFVPASSSVNGGGGGVTTAALHSLPSKYTLVLLDGQRVAPQALGSVQGGGFGVNLESIPLSAVERVEILTDGASALYGSDAIAGVVNFILKKNKTDGEVSLTINHPQKTGGASWNAAISKGVGNLDTDGFNILLSYGHDEQSKLAASQRSFSAQGAYFPFSSGGTNYIFDQRTGNTEPANLTISAYPNSAKGVVPTLASGATQQQINQSIAAGYDVTQVGSYSFNPYYTANGNCGNSLAGVQIKSASSTTCRFNYAATVQDIPSSKRDSGLVKGMLKINDDTTAWGELVLSNFSMVSQYAPSAQPMGVSATNALATLYTNYVQKYLTANNLTIDPNNPVATMGYRTVSLGGRTDRYTTAAQHVAFGVDSTFAGWDYTVSVVLSQSVLTDTAAGGYSDFSLLSQAIAAGTYDPIAGTGANSLPASTILSSQLSKTTSKLNTLHFGAQHDLFQLPGGTSIISVGGDYSYTSFNDAPSQLLLSNSGFSTQPVSSDYPVGGSYGAVPFKASRTNWGVYSEWLLPVTKQFEATVSARYDSYTKTHSDYVFNGTTVDPTTGLVDQIADADLGNTFSSATGKLSLKYTPMDNLLFRGSFGTGFKAPNMTDIAGALVFNGNTAGTYACPFPTSTGCLPGSAQYDLLLGPNGQSGAQGLKPEKSQQWTVGFRFEPMRDLSVGLDLWNVKINNQVLSQGYAEQVAFNNPSSVPANLWFNPYQDPAGFPTIAFEQQPFNGGTANYRGIDWDFSYRMKTSIGGLVARWTGTQMLKQNYNFGPGLAMNTDLGVFGPDQQVVFRTQSNITVTLASGAFSNTLNMHYKSGYQDETYAAGDGVVFLANANGTRGAATSFAGLHVPAYTTFDWQGTYDYNKALKLSLGIKNLFDKNPPLTLQNGGGGNQIGYDGRYTDPIGRQFILAGSYKF